MKRRIFKKNLFTTILLLSVLSLIPIVAFQNCSDVAFENIPAPAVVGATTTHSGTHPSGAFQINNGATYTNDPRVQLSITHKDAHKMISTNKAGCSANSDEFSDISSQMDWNIESIDGPQSVYMQFKADSGELSPCYEQQITLDRGAPQVSIDSGPLAYEASPQAQLTLSAQDTLSGIDHLLCRMDGGPLKKCNPQVDYRNLAEGSRQFQVVAVDKAGNSSAPLEHSWVIDMTAPTVKFIAPFPQARAPMNAAILHFEGKDPNGSGVDSYRCWLNNNEVANCSSPTNLMNLPDGNHEFTVVAKDKSGNLSDKAGYPFVIDTQPSGDFMVVGITGGQDTKQDNYLTDKSSPTVHWSASAGAESYRVQILNNQKQVVCGPITANGASTKVSFPANCALSENATYYADVVAIRNKVLEKSASLFAFRVDTKAPVINIVSLKVSDDQKKVDIEFLVRDATSGLSSVECRRSHGANTAAENCLNKTSIAYNNLALGDHIFKITAQDKVGHQATSPDYPFQIKQVVCDPFGSDKGAELCRRGLKAQLFYASAADRARGNQQLRIDYDNVDDLITQGLQSDAIIYFSNIDVRTRDFTEGFSATDNSYLKDEEGSKLIEWFALRFETMIKLAPNDEPGEYQFIIVSDDGSIVSIKDTPSSNYRTFINNDGITATRVGCATNNESIFLDANSRIPTMIKYYQGPRTKIGLSIFWRKAPSNNEGSQYCGKTSANGVSFGTPEHYQMLADEGWKPLQPDNFILDETKK